MQKKVVGIIAGVAAAHAVLLVSLIAGGGCRQHTVLGTHTYNNGPEFSQIPAAVEKPVDNGNAVVPPVPGGEAVIEQPPVETTPEIVQNDPADKTPASGVSTYKVKKGETLSLIAFRHGVSLQALAACNNLSGKAMDRIREGQILNIPEGAVYDEKRTPKKRVKVPAKKVSKKVVKKPVAVPADGIHVVKHGETLSHIGKRYGVSAAAIAKENNIALTKILQIGDKLRIPGAAKPANPADPVNPVPGDPVPPAIPNLPQPDPSDPANPANPVPGDAPQPPEAPSVPANQDAPNDKNTPVAPTAPASETESIEVPNDTTVEEYSKQIMVDVDVLRRLNPTIPADGKLKGGSYLLIPRI